MNVIWTEAYPNMEQTMQTENKAVYLDPFRYNEFEGFNSHNHIVVTEVGDGTSVVEVKLVQESLNPLGMAHGGFVYSMCDIAAGVVVSQYAGKFVTLSGNLYFMRPGKGKKLRCEARIIKRGRTVNVVDTCVFDDSGAVTAKGTFEIYIME